MFDALFGPAVFLLGIVFGRYFHTAARGYKLSVGKITTDGTVRRPPNSVDRVRCGEILFVVTNNRVYVNGTPWGPLPEGSEAPEVPATPETVLTTDTVVTGPLYGDLIVRGATPVNVTIQGDAIQVFVELGDVTCGDVSLGVHAGGAVTCGDVSMSVNAGGDVICGAVGLDVDAGGAVTCGDVSMSVNAGGAVTCGNVSMSVNAGGDVTVRR